MFSLCHLSTVHEAAWFMPGVGSYFQLTTNILYSGCGGRLIRGGRSELIVTAQLISVCVAACVTAVCSTFPITAAVLYNFGILLRVKHSQPGITNHGPRVFTFTSQSSVSLAQMLPCWCDCSYTLALAMQLSVSLFFEHVIVLQQKNSTKPIVYYQLGDRLVSGVGGDQNRARPSVLP